MKMIDKEVVKAGVGGVVCVGVAAIVKNLIESTAPAHTVILMKICVGVGGLFLTGALSEIAANYSGEMIEKILEAFEKLSERKEKITNIEDLAEEIV